MAGIDSSIYFQQQTADPFGSFEKGMRLGDMIKQRRNEGEIQDAYKAGMIQNPDGTYKQDMGVTLGQLAKDGHMKEYNSLAQQQKEQQAAAEKKQRELQAQNAVEIGKMAGAALQNPNAWPQIRAEAIKRGYGTEQTIPLQYDPKFLESTRYNAMSVAEQYAAEDKKTGRQFEQEKFKFDQDKSKKEFSLKEKELDLKRREAEAKAKGGENLSLENKKTVETLATKNANKVAIKNQIDAVVNGWDKLSDDQKVAQGRQLLKTLNSPEGADAIGVEEANRLGSKLEFALGNFTNSNRTQFGRDLPGFKEQATLTSQFLGEAIKSNKGQIDQAYGRTSSDIPSWAKP